jgi:hypothetical protein
MSISIDIPLFRVDQTCAGVLISCHRRGSFSHSVSPILKTNEQRLWNRREHNLLLTGVYGRVLLTKPGFTQIEIKRGMMPSHVATIRFVTRQLGQRTMLEA